MALLNKLFFPSTTTTSAPAASSKNAWTSFTSATASLSSSFGTLTASTSTASQSTPSTVNSTTGTSSTTPACVNKQHSSNNNNNHSVHSKNYLSQFPFDGRQVRVLLYRECDGRRLLFDSHALEKVPLKETGGKNCNPSREKNTHTNTTNYSGSGGCGGAKYNKHSSSGSGAGGGSSPSAFIEVCDEYGYRHNRPTSDDIMNIGEMVFGASAMSFRGTAFKIHWLQEPSRMLCSQVFLSPLNNNGYIGGGGGGGHSPYSTISVNSLATPRTSISSEHGSIDGLSLNSFSMPFSINVERQLILAPSIDVPDQQSAADNVVSGPRTSSTYSSAATDAGYSGSGSGISRSQLSSDQWSAASYQYSTRSSLGSELSEDPMRKLSMDLAFLPGSPSQLDANDSSNSSSSLQRRIWRNIRTSFENENSINDLIGFVSDHCSVGRTVHGGSEGGSIAMPNYRRASYCANESRSNPEIGKQRRAADGTTNSNHKHSSRRAKLGLAVFITMSESFEEEMELFCSEHIALLESMLSRLRVCTERAYLNHKDFYQIMFQSWQKTQQWFSDLFTAPRIQCPIWLSITTSGSKYSKNVAECFMKEFCWLLSFADTKDTNFFISTMLTAILTHHLGWVSTVSAFNSSTTLSETSASAVAIEQRAKLQQVSQKHPYNALWAQLGDLYGAIGMPPKLARTVIYGTEKLSVERLLKTLTYFIRCSEVRRSAKRQDFNKEIINTIMASQNKNDELMKKSSLSRSRKHHRQGVGGVSGSNSTGSGGAGPAVVGHLPRTQTCNQNLNTISDSCGSSAGGNGSGSGSEDSIDEAILIQNAKKNEIPNVLAFRDSRFVQQELRIGNYLMDTGIEKSSVKMRSGSSSTKDGSIRFTVTTPENIEMQFEEGIPTATSAAAAANCGDDGVLEAIEIDGNEIIESASEGDLTVRKRKSSFLWKMVPHTVKDGLSLEVHKHTNNKKPIPPTIIAGGDGGGFQLKKRSSYLSLSDLITQNSIGKSDRMTWGIEPIKENVSLEEQIHFDYSQKIIEKEHGISLSNVNVVVDNNAAAAAATTENVGAGAGSAIVGSNSAVVFVLGDNEPLINIKKSTEDLVVTAAAAAVSELSLEQKVAVAVVNDDDDDDCQKKQQQQQQHQHCPLHMPLSTAEGVCMTAATPAPHSKKHSGVKFNFQEYPQIATNYMKSKNLVMSNYDLLMEKCTKLESSKLGANNSLTRNEFPNQTETERTAAATTTTTTPQQSSSISTATSSAACIVCKGLLNSYQTPSNATELEFETDEEHSYSTTNRASATASASAAASKTIAIKSNSCSSRTLNTISSATSIDTIKPAVINIVDDDEDEDKGGKDVEEIQKTQTPATATATTPDAVRKPTYYGNVKKLSSKRGSISSVAAKCAAVNDAVCLLKFPIPGIKEQSQEEDPPDNMKLRAGFIPSLFLNVNDHYISDVVLQGTYSPPKKWETSLREDLALSARSASLISLPVENIAIIADMENWDVRLLSSQTHCFPYAAAAAAAQSGAAAPVGMSQLVSSMLEAVQAMNSSGIPAYECLSFLESKLQEIYLQSETLAAFLLETDFCSLSAVTAALNITENDVPLLLSIASIHTPQISKKCGISFR